jgi:hypothetical protein
VAGHTTSSIDLVVGNLEDIDSPRRVLGYIYHEGPQFRVDYIHDLVED